MGWLARTVSSAVAVLAVGCAALAGLGEPDDGDDAGAPEAASDGAGTTLPSPSPDDAAPGPEVDASDDAPDDAPEDAPEDAPPPCPKKANGEGCTTGSECCSNKCNEARACSSSCTNGGNVCDPFNQTSCCVGFYCTGLTPPTCAPCIASGSPAATTLNVPQARSCCSRLLDGANCL